MFELNERQRAAVEHGGSPLLIVAGAGTGKTGTLAHRVAHLLRSGADPGRVSLLTFSRRAAHELLARAGRLSDPQAAGRVWGGTFHAVGNRLLRLHGRHLGIAAGFSILDQADATEVFSLVRHDLGLGHERGTSDPRRNRFPRPTTLAAIYGRVVNTGRSLPVVLDRWFPWCATEAEGIRPIFEAYTARKRAHHLLDYDDLLLCWHALGRHRPELMAGLFDHVLVDEYQDTNTLQADILEGLRPGGTGLTAVGDDAQAIYGFRAASAGNLLRFPERFPTATVVRLEQNYRSASPILAVANAVMAESGTAGPELWSARSGRRRPLLRTCGDEQAEADAVCDSVLAHRDAGIALNRQAVLFRASHHAGPMELALSRRHVPYVKYGGLRFLEAAHVRDLISLLRVLDNPFDELAWFRILRLIEGVGAGTARRIMAGLRLSVDASTSAPADPLITPLARFLAAAPAVPAPARAELNDLRRALAECADGSAAGGATPAAGVQVERLRAWLDPVVRRIYAAADSRLADLEHLGRVASTTASRGRFVADLTLDPPTSTSDLAGPPLLDEDWLVLSTVHSAKGGEWEVVHVLHVSDGMFPSDLATGDPEGIEEERRLLYVAVTRARTALEINVPLRYHVGHNRFSDAHSYSQRSRFLTARVREQMEEAHAEGRPPIDSDAPADQGEAGEAGIAAVDRLLADLWR